MKNLLRMAMLTSMVCIMIISCVSCNNREGPTVHKLKDTSGYTYQGSNGIWYTYYQNPMGGYYYYGSSYSAPLYSSDIVSWTPTPENTSNYSSAPAEATSSITESTGTDAGGSSNSSSSSSNSSDGGSSGMSESSGSDAGGSSSGDSGGGGGNDGGGGE